MSLTLMADIRLGSPAAKFNAAFVRIGLSAGDLGASWLLPRLIGPSAAAEIGFTGRMVEADEAERLGLLNRVTGPDDLLDQTLAMASLICADSPGGIRISKRALQANMEVASFAAALELENRGQALLTRCKPSKPNAHRISLGDEHEHCYHTLEPGVATPAERRPRRTAHGAHPD